MSISQQKRISLETVTSVREHGFYSIYAGRLRCFDWKPLFPAILPTMLAYIVGSHLPLNYNC